MFEDKVIVITGGSSGLGERLAMRLAKRGARLALVARDAAKLESVRKSLTDAKAVTAHSCDVSDYPSTEKTINEIAEIHGGVDILINSAGILREGYFDRTSLDTFREVMNINYCGTLHSIRATLPHFDKKGAGRIVNICSLGGLMGAFGYAAYSSSKFAVHGLSEVLRAELKPRKIAVHCVCPPEFDSPMVRDMNANDRSPENKAIVQTVPPMDIDDVADATIEGVEAGRYMIIPGALNRVIEGMNRLVPGPGRLFVDMKLKKIYRGPSGR